MKKLFALILVLILAAGTAAADLPDLSGLSFDELVALRDQLNLAMWSSQEWQEVSVPVGVWEVGKDIPAGHWTIYPKEGSMTQIHYGEALDDTGKEIAPNCTRYDPLIADGNSNWKDTVDCRFVDIEMKEGWFLVTEKAVIIKLYAGKPDLGFQ